MILKRGDFITGIPFFFFTVFFLNPFSSLKASTPSQEMNRNCRMAQVYMVRLDFQNSIKFLNEEKKVNPGNKSITYVELKQDALKILISENHKGVENWEKRYKAFEGDLKAINLTGKLLFIWKAELLLMKAFLNVRNENYLTAVKDFKNSHGYYLEGLKRYPGNSELEKGVGLMKVLIGVIPSEYQWALKLLGFEGDLNRGFDELKGVVNSVKDSTYSYLREESLFLFTTLYSNFGKRNGLLEEMISMHRSSMIHNPLLRYAFTTALLKEGNAKNALNYFGQEPLSPELPHLNYLKGYLFLLCGKPNSDYWFNSFIKKHEGNMLRASAYQKLSWIYYLNSDLPKAREMTSKILSLSSYPTDEDLQAKNSSLQPFPAKCLLRARLNFDGGFYQESLKNLLSCEKSELMNTAEHIEFLYRLGRVNQKLGNQEKAIHCFDLTIKNGAGHKSYFAPAAALYAGNLMEDVGNNEKAMLYYKKVFEFSGYPYERSLSQKAKAGISRIKKKN